MSISVITIRPRLAELHNGENDSYIRQSQLFRSNNLSNYDSNDFSVKLTGHPYALQQFDKF